MEPTEEMDFDECREYLVSLIRDNPNRVITGKDLAPVLNMLLDLYNRTR